MPTQHAAGWGGGVMPLPIQWQVQAAAQTSDDADDRREAMLMKASVCMIGSVCASKLACSRRSSQTLMFFHTWLATPAGDVAAGEDWRSRAPCKVRGKGA
eukprot:354893-Chlamydomonas_euryale.AAC.6